MNDAERQTLADLVRIATEQQRQITLLADQGVRFGLIVQALHRRVQLLEAGTAMFEVQNCDRSFN